MHRSCRFTTSAPFTLFPSASSAETPCTGTRGALNSTPLLFAIGNVNATSLQLSIRARAAPVKPRSTRSSPKQHDELELKALQKTFNKIDRDKKGHITADDLRLFAQRRNLPSSYVAPFMAALQQQQELQQQEQELQQQFNGSSSSSGSEPDDMQDTSNSNGAAEVGFEAFRQFVLERETGLREAFQLFDTDGDGRISYEDLDLTLSRVAICSPTSSCVLRTRHQVVAELMQRLNIPEGGRLDFSEFRRYFMLLPERAQLVEYWLSGPAALACADMGSRFSILERTQAHRGSPWGHLLAGAVAGAASRSATAPLETLRLAAMAGALPPGSSLVSAGRQLVEAGGVRGLFRGNGINVLRSAPARAVDFFAFDLFKSWLGSDSYSKTFAAAGLAGSFSWMLLYPLEVVRSRITLDTHGRYGGLVHCIRTMAQQEGPASFYRGIGPSVAAIAPEAALTYGLHDLLKRGYKQMHHREPGIAASLWCGVVAAWSGQLVSFPLETVSRRMQLAGAAAAPPAAAAAAGTSAVGAPGAGAAAAAVTAGSAAVGSGGSCSMAQVLNSILQEGGFPALYRGIGAATLRLVPSAIISFGAYEVMRRLITDMEVAEEERKARAQHQQLHCVLSKAEQCNQLIQKVQQQGPSAVAALDAVQQCDACRPEVLLQAAVQGSQLSSALALQSPSNPGDNSSCSSSMSRSSMSSSRPAASASQHASTGAG